MAETMTETTTRRRRKLIGDVVSDKMDKTVVVSVERRFPPSALRADREAPDEGQGPRRKERMPDRGQGSGCRVPPALPGQALARAVDSRKGSLAVAAGPGLEA